MPTGPKDAHSTVLGIEEEVIIVAFHKHTLLPLDGSVLTDPPIGCVLIPHRYRLALTAEGKLYLYVAIDRTSTFVFVQRVIKTGRTSASAFLVALIEALQDPTVLTEPKASVSHNRIQFTFPPRYADGPTAICMTHMLDTRCRENGIEHRHTKIRHPWTNGQVERMNRTIKQVTVKRYKLLIYRTF